MSLAIASVIGTGAAAFILLNRSVFFPSESISKSRVDRAISGAKTSSTLTDDLPSIVRRRYASLRSNDGILAASARKIIEITESLEILGLRLSTRATILSFFLFSLFCGVTFSRTLKISFLICTGSSLIFIFLFTYVCVNVARRNRMTKFQQLFPDALDLVVRSVRAGLPVSEAIKMISAEIPDPVGVAFRDVSSKVGIGVPLQEALSQLATRIPIAELRFFAISLTVQQETGGNLAEILSNLSKLMRKRFQVKKKIRALSSEARASALIIGSLPFIVGAVIFSFNRSYIEVLLIEEDGRFLLGCALASIATGGAIMAKLIRFRI